MASVGEASQAVRDGAVSGEDDLVGAGGGDTGAMVATGPRADVGQSALEWAMDELDRRRLDHLRSCGRMDQNVRRMLAVKSWDAFFP